MHTITQDADGGVSKTTSPEELEALVTTLDHRGLRESALLEALEAKGVVDALRRGERLDRKPSAAPVERVQPTRRGKPAAGSRAAAKEEDAEVEGDVETQAAAWAAECLGRLVASLRKRKLACPEGFGGWKAMERALADDGMAWSDRSCGVHTTPHAATVVFLRRCAVALEGCMWAVSKDAKEAAKEATPEGSEVRDDVIVAHVMMVWMFDTRSSFPAG